MNDLSGIIDMHVHSAPDDWARDYTDFELLEAGLRVGARAIVIKAHSGTTMDRAFLCNLYMRRLYGEDTGFAMYGGITLNRAVGGVNPWAAEAALRRGAKVVWLPTLDARNHRARYGKSALDCVDVLEGGRPVPGLMETLRLVRDYDAVLATGHLSPEEIFAVLEIARGEGVQKLVVTHPEWWLVGMTLQEQARAAEEYGAVLERCFRQPARGGGYLDNLADNAEAIFAIGYRHILVSTDGGQNDNPHWEDAMAEYVRYLDAHGVARAQIRYMTRELPARLLGIDV